MSPSQDPAKLDMIRFTFTASPDHRDEIEAYLTDLGLDVFGRPDGQIVAFWEDPEGHLDEAVEHLWAINGEPFDVTHEGFVRHDHLVYHHEADDRAVA